MSGRSDWQELRSPRMADPGAAEAYDAARLVFKLGRQVRELRVLLVSGPVRRSA